MVLSACGVFECESCTHLLRGHCPGCSAGNAKMIDDGVDPCGIFKCVTSSGLTTCKECRSIVCKFDRSLEMVCPVRANFEKKRCYSRKLAGHIHNRSDAAEIDEESNKVPEKSIMRLRGYVFALDEFIANGVIRISSEDISRKVGVKSHLIRRDLSQFGEFGRPSIGYDASFLRERLAHILHLDDLKDIMWVGAARLRDDSQLVSRFQEHGFNIVAVFDTGSPTTSEHIGDLPVLPFAGATDAVRERNIQAAVLAVSQLEAQAVADILIGAGIRGILNLTSAVIVAPPGVCVRTVDVVAELFALSYYCQELHK